MPGINENANMHPTHKCSFCGKNNNQVRKIITGEGVCICDECIFLCVDIIFHPDEGKESGE